MGQTVPDRPGGRGLATRLVDAGLAWTRPEPDPHRGVTVVVPCRDRVDGLATTLRALDPEGDVIVVDDGSMQSVATAQVVAARPRTRLLRRAWSGGPAAARNDGWRMGAAPRTPPTAPRAPHDDRRTPPTAPRAPHDDRRTQPSDPGSGPADHGGGELVAFIDADCIPPPGWLADLAGHFRDPGVGAVAPRIRAGATPGCPGWLAAYERVRSPLDLGPRPAPVGPRSTVPYVPTAALVVRRAALADVDGFDERLVTGEDVDLIWRLVRAGWRVRYDPSVVVEHPVRPGLWAWASQRAGYGRSAAPLASLHGSAVSPLSISRWSATAWVVTGLGHPIAGAALVAVWAVRLAARTDPNGRRRAVAHHVLWARRTHPDAASPSLSDGTCRAIRSDATSLPPREIARLAGWNHLVAGRGLADAIRRAWWPPAVLAAIGARRVRPALAVVAVVPPLIDWRRRRPELGPVTWVALRLADDLAYGTGVWTGVVQRRQFRCLLPDLH